MAARNKIITFGVLCFTAAFLFYSNVVFAAEITIVGEVNDTFQIVADNTIYEVAETPMGDDLVKNYIAERVQVTGTVEEVDDMKIITVRSFKVVPE
ncbi:MAG: hypothetical protein JRE88_02180 [Deltaproteobacteria bacterium]|jgi:hypothetical protein|nr:hypothetical protein [Deltaproteobacteria bacterium]MBW2515568.1 hypothetical protein [Deltaproteobacteria bacterium]